MSQNPAPATGTPLERERDLIAAARRGVSPRPGGTGGTGGESSRVAINVPMPDTFAGYEVVREIHRGGQGVVYQAIQKATKRKVAIKVMREGPFAGPRDKARFEREVEILAQLDHPNIVGILDSGESNGSFFFVMDYISGKSLDAFIGENELSIEEAMALFAKICEAVNAAHLKGVIHRDLKPSNIRIDGSGEPHILDFGLAKIATGSVSDESHPHVMTMTGQFVGSLPWASPEQAAGAVGEIDLRTDVYSLGVVLYQMLTGGRFPYKVIGNMRDVLDNIMKAEPAKPSTIRRQINDEVETIVLKSLSKERDRRYQTAGELGRDVRRYLAGEPIEAKRDSGWYLLSKAMTRYRVPVGVAAAFVVLVTVSAVALGVLYQRAAAGERRAAEGEAAAVAARDDEKAQRERAEANFRAARELARTLIFDFNNRIRNLRGATKARELVLKKGLEYLELARSQATDDPALRRELAEAYERVGEIQAGLYLPHVGTGTESAANYAEARAIREKLAAANPADAGLALDVARSIVRTAESLRTARRWEAASAEYDAALRAFDRALAMPAMTDAQRPDAELERMRAIFSRAWLLRDMGVAEKDEVSAAAILSGALRDNEAAASFCAERLKSGPDDEAAKLGAQCPAQRAILISAQGRRRVAAAEARREAGDAAAALRLYEEASASFAKAREIAAGIVRELEGRSAADPASATARRVLAVAWHNACEASMLRAEAAESGMALAGEGDRAAFDAQRLGDAEEALRAIDEAIRITEPLMNADEGNLQHRRDLAVWMNKRARTLMVLRRWDEAAIAAARSLELRRDLVRTDPTQMHRLDLGVGLYRQGQLASRRAEHADPQAAAGLLLAAKRDLKEAMQVYGALRDESVLAPDSEELMETARTLGEVDRRLAALEGRELPA